MRSQMDTPARATITACVIARDEAERLPACLASVAFCDEVVVVDSGSADDTVALAHAAGATVVEEPWRGFAAQRNVALGHAHGDWVLEIDADERVTQTLRAEIEAFLAAPPAGIDLCGLPLRDVFLGRALGPSSKYPKYRHRLFRRGAHRHDEARTVHEGIAPRGAVHPFAGELTHLLAGSWREAVSDAWRYAQLETQQLDPAQPAARIVAAALLRPPAKLAYRLVVDGGWRDGWQGVAKIALDCAGDAIAWLRLLGRRGAPERAEAVAVASPEAAGVAPAPVAERPPQRRVVAVALGARAAGRASAWLAEQTAAGADAALVTGAGMAAARAPVRVRAAAGRGPLALVRALDAEEQLSPYDAAVPFGRRARLLLRVVPARLRGAAGTAQAAPARAAATPPAVEDASDGV